MKINDNTKIITGPPGTGKTRRLILMAEAIINEGCPPEYVGYISFTRQAVREASDRISRATGLPREQFSGFRTLHSLIYWLLGFDTSQIVKPDDLANFDQALGHYGRGNHMKELMGKYSHMYGYHRVSGEPLEKVWEKMYTPRCGTEIDFMQWIVDYRNYKAATNKIDFYDMVDQFAEKEVRFPFTYLFLDEAQDFTPDQWAAVKLLAKDAGTVIVAGDPDQAIFTWAGVDANIFESIEGDKETLGQSHRVPKRPHILAARTLAQMGRKINYLPTEREGTVNWINQDEMFALPFDNNQSWFVLCRHQYLVKRMKSWFYDQGIYHTTVSGNQAFDNYTNKNLARIKWYESARNGAELSNFRERELQKIVPDLYKKLAKDIPWYNAFATWPIKRIEYFLQNKNKWDNPNIAVGTFHSSKGAEADNVILYGECTNNLIRAYENHDPDELRVLYVALTRAKKNLILVQSEWKEGIPWHQLFDISQDRTNGLL